MGLDMYLEAHVFINEKDEGRIIEAAGISELIYDMYFTGLKVKVDCIYWRKANAIHNWFVQNIQDGKDDCGRYYVSIDQLETLRQCCKDVLDYPNPEEAAKARLPTTSGFFYGTTDYDDWYFTSLKYTIMNIERVMKILKDDDRVISFYYTSSW